MSSQLQGLKSSANQLAKQRMGTADSLYRQGILELQKFQKELHPQYFKKAFECFSRALQRSRTQPQSYNAMAYLWILLEDYSTALKFLQAQEQSCKSAANAQPLILYLQKKATWLFPELVQKANSIEENPKPEDIIMAQEILSPPVPQKFQTAELTLDFEALYERVEKKIYSSLKMLMQLQLPDFTYDSQEFKKIKVYQEKHQNDCLELTDRIRFLEQELDVTGLEQNLKNLEIYLQRIDVCLNRSKKARRTRRGMLTLNTEISDILKELRKNPQSFVAAENKLEELLDQCDAFADVIDEFDEAGLDVSILENTYNKLVAGLETLQDRLDDICAP